VEIDWANWGVALWLLYKFVGFLQKRRAGQGTPAPEGAPSGPDVLELAEAMAQEAQRVQEARTVGELARLRTLPLAGQAQQLAAGFARLHRPGARVGTGDVLHTLVVDDLTPAIAAAQHEVELAMNEGILDATDGALAQAMRRLRKAEGEIRVLDRLLTWHQDPRMDTLLADAEAIAEAFLAPWQHHANSYGLSFPTQHPICAPADPDSESLWLGLLPAHHPVVFVPDDFDQDLYRWVSVAHEIGHLAWLKQAGLAEELADLAHLHGRGRLLGVQNGRIAGSLEDLFAAWWPELIADMVTMLSLGPAGLRGMVETFARPAQPGSVLLAPAKGGTYDEHPPDHLRVELAALWLEAMGFRTEGLQMLEAWSQAHGQPDRLLVATRNDQTVALPLQPFVDFGRELVDLLYRAELQSLAGHQLRAVPGLEMTPGRWAAVLACADQLLAGRARHGDPAILLAATIVARHRRPSSHAALADLLRRAVVGRGSDEPAAASKPPVRRRAPASTSRRRELLDAIVLQEVILARPKPLRRSRSG